MAKISFGPVVGDARGKTGGNVFTKGRAGAVLRHKVSPIQPRTAAQRNVRANFTANAKSWQTLTAAEQQSFVQLAATLKRKGVLGATKSMTGLQLYQQLNRNIAVVGGTPIVTAPATLVASSPGSLTLTIHSATSTVSVTPANNPLLTNEYYVIYGSNQVSPGKLTVGKQYKFIQAFVGSSTPPLAAGAAYVAIYGALINGRKIFINVKVINSVTGAAGVPSNVTGTVVT